MEQVELKEDRDVLHNAYTTLSDRFQQIHQKMRNMLRVTLELEKKYDLLKTEKTTISEADKQRIIEEYQESPELTYKIIFQFIEGCQSHKDKIRKMLADGLDTNILDSSDDEANSSE